MSPSRRNNSGRAMASVRQSGAAESELDVTRTAAGRSSSQAADDVKMMNRSDNRLHLIMGPMSAGRRRAHRVIGSTATCVLHFQFSSFVRPDGCRRVESTDRFRLSTAAINSTC